MTAFGIAVAKIVISGIALIAWICLLLMTRRLWSSRDKEGIYADPLVSLWLKRVVLTLILLVLPAAAGYVIWPFAACVRGGLDIGVTRYGGECVGVTDGRHSFSGGFTAEDVGDATRRRLDTVEDVIKRQNDEIPQNDETHRSVQVAFLSPLTSPLAGPRAVDELEGAAAAQKKINQDQSPKIKLLVAHMGSSESQWEAVVQQLIDMKGDNAPLVAVVGLGLSQNEANLAAKRLADARIPMVASSLTATDLDPKKPETYVDGFHQVSHTNQRQIDALFTHLKDSGVDLSDAVVVRSDNKSDLFADSSAKAFVAGLSPRRPVPIEFGSPDGDQGELTSQFTLITESLCRKKDVVIFYAGRSRFLSTFMQKLDASPCLNSVLVMSASDAAVLRMKSGDPTAQEKWGIDAVFKVLKNGKVSLRYTPSTDFELVEKRNEYLDLKKNFGNDPGGFNEDDLRTRWAITSWDSLQVIAAWVLRAGQVVKGAPPHAVDVGHASTQVFTDKTNLYHGASGDFWFDDRGRRTGDSPKVVQLMGDEEIQVVS